MQHNLRTRIVQLLAEQKEPIRKSRMAIDLGVSYTSLAHPLAELNNAFLIHQSRGYYRITPDGKAALEQDPTLSSFFMRQSNAIVLKLSPKDFDIPVCNLLLHTGANNGYEDKISRDRARRGLLPFVMLYLIASGKSFPVGKAPFDFLSPEDEAVWEGMRAFFKEQN